MRFKLLFCNITAEKTEWKLTPLGKEEVIIILDGKGFISHTVDFNKQYLVECQGLKITVPNPSAQVVYTGDELIVCSKI